MKLKYPELFLFIKK